jgi:mono/diheme cytochrome c family protein
MRHWHWAVGAVLCCGLLGGLGYWILGGESTDMRVAEAAEKIDGTKLSYSKDIQPILQQNCVNCHNANKRKAGLDLSTSHATTMKGIKAEQPDQSKLYKSLIGKGAKQMPPKNKLADNDIEKVRAWIEAGAKNN